MANYHNKFQSSSQGSFLVIPNLEQEIADEIAHEIVAFFYVVYCLQNNICVNASKKRYLSGSFE